MMSMNLLFTSVGRRSYLLKYFRDAMEECDRIFAANSTALNPAFYKQMKVLLHQRFMIVTIFHFF